MVIEVVVCDSLPNVSHWLVVAHQDSRRVAPSRWGSSSAFLMSDRRLRQGEGMNPVKSLVPRGLIAFSPGIFIFFGVRNMCDSFILVVQQEQLSARRQVG